MEETDEKAIRSGLEKGIDYLQSRLSGSESGDYLLI